MAAPRTADAAPITAKSAASFVNSIGVDTHFSYNDTPYVTRFQEVKAKLVELGVHHIREDLLPDRPDQYVRLNELAAAGIGSTLIMGSPENGTAGLEELLSIARNRLTGVDALEGPNEPYSNDNEPNWTSTTDAYQQALHERATNTPQLASLPIVGPTTIFWQKGELGNISPWLTYGDIHPYSGGYPPEDYLERHVDFAALSSGSKPLMATETGFHNAMNWTGDFPPTSEAATAVYIPRIFLDYFQQGIARTFDYELVDEFPDPSGDEREAHFGLLRNDLSPKPAFTALKNLISIVGDSDESFTPGALNYSISGNTEKLHEVLLQKADGSFYLALWRSSSVWDPVKQVALSPPTMPVTVHLGQSPASAAEYRPNKSSAPLSQLPTSGALQVNVGPEVVILKLDSTGAPSTAGEVPAGTEPPPITAGPEPGKSSAGPERGQTSAPGPVKQPGGHHHVLPKRSTVAKRRAHRDASSRRRLARMHAAARQRRAKA
ncbi:MAG TPA: hypothetical protein VHA80_07825 [Solirubrobacterales bacterium]|nr:hypothetical protein [Solirubrobacterales bacterium]